MSKDEEDDERLEIYVNDVKQAFYVLSRYCPSKLGSDPDCHHPDIDFDHMLCDPSNCPLLL
jgi:predicted nucleotidyltransferase